jgi:hypothetical protein
MLRFAVVLTCLASPAFAQSVFSSTDAAQAHCPSDTVVWLNTTKHVYRLPAQKGYGKAKSSQYACQQEANAAGDRAKKDKPAKDQPAVDSTGANPAPDPTPDSDPAQQ